MPIDPTHAFEFGQKNPNAKFSDYLAHQSRNITKSELNRFKDFSYDKINLTLKGQEYSFLVFRNIRSYLNLESLPTRLAGVREHYLLTPMPGEWYSGICVLHIPDSESQESFFCLNDWDLYQDHKGLLITGSEDLIFTFFFDADIESDKEWKYPLLKNYNSDKPGLIKLWDNQSELHGYINPNSFNWKPIDDLFQIID
jgi:hypothetical protein